MGLGLGLAEAPELVWDAFDMPRHGSSLEDSFQSESGHIPSHLCSCSGGHSKAAYTNASSSECREMRGSFTVETGDRRQLQKLWPSVWYREVNRQDRLQILRMPFSD